MAYDVFISFKNTAPGGGLTVDRAIAERLHTKLRDEGLEVFFSEKDLSTTAFMNEIYRALEEAPLLILIGSSIDYIKSKWVMSEWQNFLGAMNIGKKPDGEIMTVLSGITNRDLPIELANFQFYDAEDLDGAVDFAFKALGKVKKSEAAEWLAREEERKRREAEEAALLEVQKRLEAERQAEREKAAAEKERAAAEKRRQKALAAAERERQNRINAERKAAEAQEHSKKQAGQNRALKIVAALLAAALIWGGSYCVGAYVTQQKELARIEEEQRLVEEQRIAANQSLERQYDFFLTDDGGGYTITKYKGDGGDVVLPETYKDKPVVRIGNMAFQYCADVTSITIPDSVTSIGQYAFERCTSLYSITIPDSVVSIGHGAFYGCTITVKAPRSQYSYGSPYFGGGVTWKLNIGGEG